MTLPAIPFRLPFSTPPERRSPREIDDDLDAEFAFHIEMKTRDLIEAGHAPDEAAAMARQSFGNIESIKQTCRRLALKEQLMLQRVNFVMMILVLIVLGFVGVQVYTTQRHNTLALQAITSELTKMKYAAQPSNANDTSNASSDAGATARILVEGNIANPGWHEISLTTGTTIRDLLQRLNVSPKNWVMHRNAGSSNSPAVVPAEFYYVSSDAIILRPADEMRIFDEVDSKTRRAFFNREWRANRIGPCWMARDESGTTYHVGRITLSGRPVNANTTDYPTLVWEGGSGTVNVKLSASAPQGGIYIPDTAWDYIDGRLVLDVSEIPSSEVRHLNFGSERLAFESVSDCKSFERTYLTALVAQAVERSAIEVLSRANGLESLKPEQQNYVLTDENLSKSLSQLEDLFSQYSSFNEQVSKKVKAMFDAHRAQLEADERWSADSKPENLAAALREFAVRIVQAAFIDYKALTPLEAIDRIQMASESTRGVEISPETRKLLDSARSQFAPSDSAH